MLPLKIELEAKKLAAVHALASDILMNHVVAKGVDSVTDSTVDAAFALADKINKKLVSDAEKRFNELKAEAEQMLMDAGESDLTSLLNKILVKH